jgi:hypothetical protein
MGVPGGTSTLGFPGDAVQLRGEEWVVLALIGQQIGAFKPSSIHSCS